MRSTLHGLQPEDAEAVRPLRRLSQQYVPRSDPTAGAGARRETRPRGAGGRGEGGSVRPYYEADGITLYHGDSLELSAALPQADLFVLDPPFFMPAQHYAARSEWARSWGDTAILRRWWGGALDSLIPRL